MVTAIFVLRGSLALSWHLPYIRHELRRIATVLEKRNEV